MTVNVNDCNYPYHRKEKTMAQAMAKKTLAAEDHVGVMQCQAVCTALAIPWQMIWQWLVAYGFPLVTQLLAILLPLILGQKTVDWGKVETYGLSVLQALEAGQPIPAWVP